MAGLRRAWDYEERLGNGAVRIYEGHPCYCPETVPHEPHEFSYIYADSRGNVVGGRYDCRGVPVAFAKRES